LTEQDGSFRRLIETVKEQQGLPSGRPGRPPKNRIPTTGHFMSHLHDRMRTLAQERTQNSDHLVSISDLYNEAALQLIADLHQLLGEELRLPAGAMTLPAILGLRELIDRPITTPLRELELQADQLTRTTLHIDPAVWDALLEMSLRFGLRMRRAIHVHRLVELAAAWYLSGVETQANP
jgi:hypothetical protein